MSQSNKNNNKSLAKSEGSKVIAVKSAKAKKRAKENEEVRPGCSTSTDKRLSRGGNKLWE